MRSPKRSDDTRQRKRIGRGEGSGTGKTSGRGHKGCQSPCRLFSPRQLRGWHSFLVPALPQARLLERRLPKHYHVVNLKVLEERFDAGATIDVGCSPPSA